MKIKMEKEDMERYLDLKTKAIKLIESGYIYSIEKSRNEDIVIICSGSLNCD